MMSIPVSTFAAENNHENVVYETPVESEKFVDPAPVNTTLPYVSGIARANNYGERHVLSKTFTTKKTVTSIPSGQPGLGYVGKPGKKTTVFLFSGGGGSQKFTVTINAKAVTFTAELGRVTLSGGGIAKQVPMRNGKFKIKLTKYYTIESKKYDVYKQNEYQYSYMKHETQYALDDEWIQV